MPPKDIFTLLITMDLVKTPDARSRADCNENRIGWDQ